MRPPRAFSGGWLLWTLMLAMATDVLLTFRNDIDQSTAVLTLLLVVLGGSVAGGRALGFALACVSFASIDYFFQPPYDQLSINKPLDGIVLLAFLAVAGATTDLLVRARQEARAAQQRASEVASLAALGSATLRYAEPEDAFNAIAALVREQIGAVACSVVPLDAMGRLRAHPPSDGSAADALITSTAALDAANGAWENGVAMLVGPAESDAQVARADLPGDTSPSLQARFLALPLRAEARLIGLMLVRGDPVLMLDAPRRRFLTALTYYAALAVERQKLVAEASHSEALREANRAKDQILASVSHDLRTPLTTIKVLAQGAESRGEPAAAAIVEQADRLARMVGDLLELSRLRAGGLSMRVELNTAEDVVGAALRRTEGVVDDRAIAPHIDLESPALVGRFDFVHTLRILGNLLDNALRFTPPHGVVDVSVTREEGWLRFVVADRGSGVPAQERQRIFEPFYRPADAMPDAGHAGLGLSIARTLAELQGGTLTFALRVGGGSEFILRLPAADVSDEPASEGE